MNLVKKTEVVSRMPIVGFVLVDFESRGKIDIHITCQAEKLGKLR